MFFFLLDHIFPSVSFIQTVSVQFLINSVTKELNCLVCLGADLQSKWRNKKITLKTTNDMSFYYFDAGMLTWMQVYMQHLSFWATHKESVHPNY